MASPAVYAGSFDPPTNGHVWMIERAAQQFDRLIVAAAKNPEKRYGYPLATRVRWLREICSPYDNVEVVDIQNEFLARFAHGQGVKTIVRGIRNESDYQYERAMRYINSDLAPGVTSVFLMPPRELCEISSSLVKNMIGPAGWEDVVRHLVPACVYEDLLTEGRGDTPRISGADADADS